MKVPDVITGVAVCISIILIVLAQRLRDKSNINLFVGISLLLLGSIYIIIHLIYEN